MPHVFIPQLPSIEGQSRDTSDAVRYGEFVTVFNPRDRALKHECFPDNAVERMPRLMRYAADVMADFQPGEDFLMLAGGPIYVAICTAVLARRHHNITALRFDNKEQAYYPIQLDSIEE